MSYACQEQPIAILDEDACIAILQYCNILKPHAMLPNAHHSCGVYENDLFHQSFSDDPIYWYTSFIVLL